MHDINSAKGWSPYVIIVPEKFSDSSSNWRSHWNSLFYFQSQFFFMNRLINSLFLASFFPLSLEVSDLLKISEPLTCLFTAIENSGSTGNTMKNLKKKMRRLPRLPHLNSDPTTNTAIPGTYFHPVRDRFWPAAYISFCRCF